MFSKKEGSLDGISRGLSVWVFGDGVSLEVLTVVGWADLFSDDEKAIA